MFEDKVKKIFVEENHLFFDPMDGNLDSLHLPIWSHEIFKKYFIELALFFYDISKPIPKIVGVRFFNNEWRIIYKNVEYTLMEEVFFKTLINSLEDDLKKAMTYKPK